MPRSYATEERTEVGSDPGEGVYWGTRSARWNACLPKEPCRAVLSSSLGLGEEIQTDAFHLGTEKNFSKLELHLKMNWEVYTATQAVFK